MTLANTVLTALGGESKLTFASSKKFCKHHKMVCLQRMENHISTLLGNRESKRWCEYCCQQPPLEILCYICMYRQPLNCLCEQPPLLGCTMFLKLQSLACISRGWHINAARRHSFLSTVPNQEHLLSLIQRFTYFGGHVVLEGTGNIP